GSVIVPVMKCGPSLPMKSASNVRSAEGGVTGLPPLLEAPGSPESEVPASFEALVPASSSCGVRIVAPSLGPPVVQAAPSALAATAATSDIDARVHGRDAKAKCMVFSFE